LVGWILASAIIGTAGRFLIQTYAQSLSAHSHGVVILILEPVWVSLFAALWFGETMSGTQLGGCALIFAALLVNRWGALSKALKTWLRNQKTS
ncbi:EamA family transporter, partial [Marinobacter sediminum]|uniref:EamA family transporter n=1 Tax=Marinobacter sediminum TaxID=256323 RepID=UPI003565863D